MQLPPGTSFHVEPGGSSTISRPFTPRAPGPGEVLIAVAGSALGAEPGAEIAGQVIAAGDAATEWIGRQVVAPRVLPCGECDLCRRARTTGCAARPPAGPVATHATLPARYLLALEPPLVAPGGQLWPLAALSDAASTPYQLLVRAQLGPGDLLIVVGANVAGCFAVSLGRALGAHVAAIDAEPAHRERATAAGAWLVVDGATHDGPAARAAILAAAVAAGHRTVEAKILDATGTTAGRRRALEMCGPGDTAAFLSSASAADAPGLAAALDGACAREAQIVTAAACHPDLLPELAALVVRGDLPLAPHVTPFPFSALADALAQTRRGQLHTLPILVPDPT